MTFNWGHKLTLGFCLFAGMMTYLVYQSMHTRYDLVSKEYYKEELQYQQIIDGTQRAALLSTPVTITQADTIFILRLPPEMKQQIVSGNVLFYCAGDAQKDRNLSLQPDEDAAQYINVSQFLPGNYTVKVRWQANGQQYYSELFTTIH